MRIGLVRRGHSGTGGAEAYLRRFADALRDAGHEPVLFGSVEWTAEAWPGKKIVLGGRTPREFADALRSAEPRRECDFLFSLERVWQCDAFRAGDGVHAVWLERRAKFEPWWRSLFRRMRRKHREIIALEKALFTGGAGRVIANSRMVRDEIAARFHTPADRLHVVYNGVPAPAPAERAAERAKLGLGVGEYAVLFAGSGWERKGLRFAIEAAEGICTLLIAGEGRRRGLPLGGRILGPQSRREMDGLLAAADAFVLPTLYEPFSNACLEAAAAGLPVITTTANGFAEVIEPGKTGDIVPVGDVPALREALVRWKGRARIASRAEEFTVEKNVAETLRALGFSEI